MIDAQVKSIKNNFTPAQINVITEALDAYNRYVKGNKQNNFEAKKLHQLFSMCK